MGQGAKKGGGWGGGIKKMGGEGEGGMGTLEWHVLEDGRAVPRPYLEGVPTFQKPA